MICPFCQHDLNVEEGLCPNCAAVYPRPSGLPFGVKVRTVMVGGVMTLFSVIMLFSCTLKYIQSNYEVPACQTRSTGGNCEISTREAWISPQTSQFGGPDMKTPELQQLLLMWNNGEQPTQNNSYTMPKKTPSR
jgi:hypothetical protein